MPIMKGQDERDFTASDILAPQRWASATSRPAFGLDVTCTKIAVDFQNLEPKTAEAVVKRNLELLREATGTDTAFLATYDSAAGSILSIDVSKGLFVSCITIGSWLPPKGWIPR